MSMTDGQWILDMKVFKDTMRPAVSTGLSVTRVGGVGHKKRQKNLAAETLKTLAAYREAEEFSHFGSELALEAQRALDTGKLIFQVLTQSPTQVFSFMGQQLMLDIVLHRQDNDKIDIAIMQKEVNKIAETIPDDSDGSDDHEESNKLYDKAKADLQKLCVQELKK
jgi:F-type H+-transporting ATPase subunit alpha